MLFVGDGYTAAELVPAGKYWLDVERHALQLFGEMPFIAYKDSFNVRAMFLESKDAGCDPALGSDEKDTALDSSFDSTTGRLLDFGDKGRLARLVRDVGQTDIIFVMVNTSRYGGAGGVMSDLPVRGRPCPAPSFAADDGESFFIAMHELGHSFAALADEYEDAALHSTYPIPDVGDVPAANATLPRCVEDRSIQKLARTLKWGHFLRLPNAEHRTWLHDGGYYRATGVFRPWEKCRMRVSRDPYCPICAEELAKAIADACGDRWNDDDWHKQHPLSSWK